MLSVRILVFTRTHAHKHTQIDMDLPRDSRTGVTKEEDKGIIECCVLFQDLVLWVFCVLFQDLVLWFLQVAQCSHISSLSDFFQGRTVIRVISLTCPSIASLLFARA
jgi:hypothetical protein